MTEQFRVFSFPYIATIATALRVVFFALGATERLEKRIELSTAVNQWSRLREGVHLLENGYSPYDGDICHEPPLVLYYFKLVLSFGQWSVYIHYIMVDLVIAYSIWRFVDCLHRNMVISQAEERAHYGKGSDQILIKLDKRLPDITAALYLLNPLTILTTCSLSTVHLNTLFIALFFSSSGQGNFLCASLFLAVSSYLSIYPAMLLVPLVVLAFQDTLASLLKVLFGFTVSIFGLLAISYLITGSVEYMSATYETILLASDLTPNFGLFWYFFTEMFDHFRSLFLSVLQINAFIMAIPLTIRLYEKPLFVCYLLVSLISVYKSYPCLGDVLLPIALLPLWGHLYRNMRFTLAVLVMFVIAIIIGPVFYHLWTSTGSINSNFFFAMTLVYSLSQIFLVSDLIHSELVYQYDLKHGWPRVDKEGNHIKLKLT